MRDLCPCQTRKEGHILLYTYFVFMQDSNIAFCVVVLLIFSFNYNIVIKGKIIENTATRKQVLCTYSE